MSDATLVAQTRSEFGKGAARRTRRAGRVPAVLYGHGTDPVHVSLPGHETFMALKVANALLTIDLDGEERLALAKDVQRDPIRGSVEHVDLLLVRRGEKVIVEVPVHVVGEPYPGSIHTVELQTIRLEADATALPERVEVNIEGMEPGSLVHTRDLVLPEGSTLAESDELAVVNVVAAQIQVDEDEEEAEEAAAAAPAEEEAEEA